MEYINLINKTMEEYINMPDVNSDDINFNFETYLKVLIDKMDYEIVIHKKSIKNNGIRKEVKKFINQLNIVNNINSNEKEDEENSKFLNNLNEQDENHENDINQLQYLQSYIKDEYQITI